MARKNAPARAAAAPADDFPLLLVMRPEAPASETVVTRKRARRARTEAPAPALAAPVKIDLTQPNAKDALVAAYPRPTRKGMIPATPETERAALAYLESRDAEARAAGAKEAQGNALRHAIAEYEGIQGDGWVATWLPQRGQIDWSRLIKELNITAETVERFRKPDCRVLQVREKEGAK